MTDPRHRVTDEEIVTWLAGDLSPDHEAMLLTKFDKDPSVPGRIERMTRVEELFRVRTRPAPIRERDQPDATRAARLDELLWSLENHAEHSQGPPLDPTPLHRGSASDHQGVSAGERRTPRPGRHDGSAPDGHA